MAQIETDDVASGAAAVPQEHAAVLPWADAAVRTVVVTGGGSGIGRAIAERFAAGGDEVVIIGRREELLRGVAADLGARHGVRVAALACDLADPGQVEAALSRLPDRIDVLVNSAGSREPLAGSGPRGVLARWRGDFERNVLTAVLLTESVRDRLTPDGGRIVTVSSLAALRGGGSYGAAKAALHAWNHSLAAQLGPQGVTCNIVAPGTVAGTEFFGARLNDAELTRRAGRTLVGRVGRPSDVASAVVFLASPDAGFITGEILQCNGGELLGR